MAAADSADDKKIRPEQPADAELLLKRIQPYIHHLLHAEM